VDAPKRSGNSTSPPSPYVNASGGVPENTSPGCGSRISRPNVSQVAKRSRWKCTQPFGTPVVPEVKAMIAASSAPVSTGSKRPSPPAPTSSSARMSSSPALATSPASGPSTRAWVTWALSITFASSPARSSGIVATTMPPARRMPSQAAIAAGELAACRSTRVPGSMPSAAA
jgi:hypothetical protein